MDKSDSLTLDSGKPNVDALIKEFSRAGAGGNFWDRLQLAENTRMAKWEGQSDDGKKWDDHLPEGQRAFPFNGASDVRCFQSDEIINEQVAIDTTAFWNADLRVQPVGMEDGVDAANATVFLDWLKNKKLASELEEEVELSSQYRHTYGWTALHPTWRREIAYKLRKLTFEEMAYTADTIAQMPPDQMPPEQAQMLSAFAVFPDLIRNMEMESQAVEIARYLYRVIALNSLAGNLEESDIPVLKAGAAKKMVRDLRDGGQTEVPVPYLCRNHPCVRALRPWRDVVVPSYTTDIQSAPAVFVIEYMTEAQLKAMEMADGWDGDWIEAACKTKGHVSTWTESTGQNNLASFTWNGIENDNQLIEVIWAYHRRVDEFGVSGVYYAVISAHASQPQNRNLYAKEGLLNYPHNQYPIIPIRRERLDRAVMATRGVPEVCLTSQREEKVQRDALIDLTSISVAPPLNVYKGAAGQSYTFGPAQQNIVTPGREPKLMDIPTKGMVPAIETLELIDRKVGRYFGRFNADIPPALSQLIQGPGIRRFLSAWGQAFAQCYHLCLKFAPEIVERVTGAVPQSVAEYDPGDYDFVFHFDTMQLNPDLMTQKIEAFSRLISEDVTGAVDKNKWLTVRARMIDPAIAKELIVNPQSASEALFRQVSSDLQGMFLGNEGLYVDATNDPTAPTKLQYAMQILGKNPKYMAALDPQLVIELFPQMPQQQMPAMGQADPVFTAYVKNYIDNMKMGAEQQANKLVGRTGVKALQ